MTQVEGRADVQPVKLLGHVPALDGLRGIAILAVTLFHFYGLPGGFYGVDLFFVLSGFLITSLLIDEYVARGSISLSRFYLRRARRLLPAVGFVLVLVLPFTGWKVTAEGGLYISNFVRAFVTPDPLRGSSVNHLWSLAQEEQFYSLWPPLLLALLALRTRKTTIPCALALLFGLLVGYRIILAWQGASPERLYFGPDTHADGLVLGCLLAFARGRALASWLVALAAAFATVCLATATQTTSWQTVGLPLFELAAGVLVLAACSPGVYARALCFRPLRLLGVISYSLYLWQEPVRGVFGWGESTIALPFAVMMAVISYRYVERPVRNRFRKARSDDQYRPVAVGV